MESLALLAIIGMMLGVSVCCCGVGCACAETCATQKNEIQITIDGYSGTCCNGMNGTWIIPIGVDFRPAGGAHYDEDSYLSCEFYLCGDEQIYGVNAAGWECMNVACDPPWTDNTVLNGPLFDNTITGHGIQVSAAFRNTCGDCTNSDGTPLTFGALSGKCQGASPGDITVYLEVIITHYYVTNVGAPFAQSGYVADIWRSGNLGAFPLDCAALEDGTELTYYGSAHRYSYTGGISGQGTNTFTVNENCEMDDYGTPPGITIDIAWA